MKSVRLLRNFRVIHRRIAAVLFIFFLITALSGLLLGWKKHSGGILLAETPKGSTTDLKQWLPIDSLHAIAIATLKDSISENLNVELDRIDGRPEKGVLKFTFKAHYWGIQLDASTGKVLMIERRYADLIENIHDGSILDNFASTESGQFKLIYTSIMGVSLLMLTISGAYLYFKPKDLRRKKNR